MNRVSGFLCLLVFCFITVSVSAKEVSIRYGQLTLNAAFEKSADNVASESVLSDRVLLITHGGLAHRDMETITYLRKLFKEKGYNTLAINLSLGIDNRNGMYDCTQMHRHTNEDAVNEIGAWLDWLRKQGMRQAVLLGHSRGGAQTALFAARKKSTMVTSVVLMAPATGDNTGVVAYRNRYGAELMKVLRHARQLEQSGKTDAVLEKVGLMLCRETSATVKSFLSYYAPHSYLDTPTLLPELKVPALVVVAGDDAVVKGLERRISSQVDGRKLQMVVIEGADHMFRDLYADDAVEAIDEFLQSDLH